MSGQSRRAFLAKAGRASAGAACTGLLPWTAGCASFPRVTPLQAGQELRIPLAAFGDASGVLFEHPEEGMPVYVHRHGEGRFTAVLTRCSHRGCEVEPTPSRMVCPCHGSEYAHDGALLQGPADRPLLRYPATSDGTWVRIDLGAPGAGGRAGRSGGAARRLGPVVLGLFLALAVVPAALRGQEPDTTRTAQDGLYDRPFITSLGGTAVGGYVEGNTNYFLEDGIGDGFSMELRRFNIFLFSAISSRIRLISELEFEHGTEEIALETALLDFQVNPSLTLRGGILLPPLGYVNLNHDSPRWNFVERPLVSTEIIPSTLSEVGFGVLGKLYPGSLTVSYDLYLTNGLQDGIVGNEEGRTHIPHGKSEEAFGEDNNGSPALTGRLAVGHAGRGEIGGSFYTALYNTFRIEGDEVDDGRRVTILALDGQASVGRVGLRGEFALAEIDVPESLSELFGHRQWGGHVDLTVPIWQPSIAGYEAPSVLSLDLRLERIDMNVGTFGSTGKNIFDETTAVVPGVSFRPSASTVFRANYRREWIRDFLGNPTNVRAGYQFGLATYF